MEKRGEGKEGGVWFHGEIRLRHDFFFSLAIIDFLLFTLMLVGIYIIHEIKTVCSQDEEWSEVTLVMLESIGYVIIEIVTA